MNPDRRVLAPVSPKVLGDVALVTKQGRSMSAAARRLADLLAQTRNA